MLVVRRGRAHDHGCSSMCFKSCEKQTRAAAECLNSCGCAEGKSGELWHSTEGWNVTEAMAKAAQPSVFTAATGMAAPPTCDVIPTH